MISRLISILFLFLLLTNKVDAQKLRKQEFKFLLEKYGEKTVFYALLGEKSLKRKVTRNLSYKDFDLSYFQIEIYQHWGRTYQDSNRLFKKFLHGGVYEKISKTQVNIIIKNGESVNMRKLHSFLVIYNEYLQLKQQISECSTLDFEENADFEAKIIQKYYPNTLFKAYCKAIYFWYSDCTEEINAYGFNEIGITAMINYLINNNHTLLSKIKDDYCKGKKE